jgi:hypothetical protein
MTIDECRMTHAGIAALNHFDWAESVTSYGVRDARCGLRPEISKHQKTNSNDPNPKFKTTVRREPKKEIVHSSTAYLNIRIAEIRLQREFRSLNMVI